VLSGRPADEVSSHPATEKCDTGFRMLPSLETRVSQVEPLDLAYSGD